MESKKLVLFGAGKVGRSFIGQLFSRSDYQVVFVDIDERIISALNQQKKYQIIIKSDDGDEVIWVENVHGVLATDVERVAEEIASADILATAVGQHALPKIVPVIAKGLELRFKINPTYPMDIVLAENLRDAAKIFKYELHQHVQKTIDLDRFVGLVETSIGKMVPIMPKSAMEKDPLLVYAEAYNTLILDKKAFKNPIPQVEGLAPKENMAAWVDRKSFIHNLGHAAAAYYGFSVYPAMTYLHEIISRSDVYKTTRATMMEAAAILIKHYPGEFSKANLTAHIDDLLLRFSNKALGDTVFRVGQDLYRKLGPEDRLVGVLRLALKYRMPYDKILYIIACAMDFKAVDELGKRSQSDDDFSTEAKLGVAHMLESVCGLSLKKYPEIHKKAQEYYMKTKHEGY